MTRGEGAGGLAERGLTAVVKSARSTRKCASELEKLKLREMNREFGRDIDSAAALGADEPFFL